MLIVRKVLIIFCIVPILIFSCDNNSKKSLTILNPAKDSAQVPVNNLATKQTFFDSIWTRSELSAEQIKHHTLLGNAYFNPKWTFTGDTIYYPQSARSMAIITISDNAICSKKILLVYNSFTVKNSDFLLVETDCDEDYSTDYDYLKYQIFNADLFYTRHVFYIRDTGKKTKIKVKDTYYRIGKDNKIKKLSAIPSGFSAPRFIPPTNIDDTE